MKCSQALTQVSHKMLHRPKLCVAFINLRRSRAMDEVHIMIALVVTGFTLLVIGFSNRNQEWGVWLISLGMLSMFVPILLKVYWELT
jgi:hypothetical protein